MAALFAQRSESRVGAVKAKDSDSRFAQTAARIRPLLSLVMDEVATEPEIEEDNMKEQKVALVTGVSSGIGRATATALAEEGFRTFGTMRDATKVSQGPRKVELVPLDVRDEGSIRSAVNTVLERAGRIDVLVNNAGIALIGSSEETSIEEARHLFETNFFGVLRLTQQLLPVMRSQRSGRIINISSVVGFLPAPYMAVYAASKHAIEGYSESLDHELRQFGIHVSLIEPGFTRTDLARNAPVVAQPQQPYSRERGLAIEAIRKAISSGDDPTQVASVVLKALRDREPRLRYQAGHEAKTLSRLKTWAPSKLVDKGLRKKFGLPPTQYLLTAAQS
jgi:NAD(P)-dependent dehydrogenase (short-subunit alcohol dehydrogenase family)